MSDVGTISAGCESSSVTSVNNIPTPSKDAHHYQLQYKFPWKAPYLHCWSAKNVHVWWHQLDNGHWLDFIYSISCILGCAAFIVLSHIGWAPWRCTALYGVLCTYVPARYGIFDMTLHWPLQTILFALLSPSYLLSYSTNGGAALQKLRPLFLSTEHTIYAKYNFAPVRQIQVEHICHQNI